MQEIPKDAIKCLDKGFVRLVDSMGGDDAIVQSARVSYGKGTSKVSQDRGLIRYLMRHRHSTPFEMVEFKFHCKMPIFVARQWVRHRTANINEYSLRYSFNSCFKGWLVQSFFYFLFSSKCKFTLWNTTS